MAVTAQGDERRDTSRYAGIDVGPAEIAVIGQHGFSPAQFFRQGAGFGQHRPDAQPAPGRNALWRAPRSSRELRQAS